MCISEYRTGLWTGFAAGIILAIILVHGAMIYVHHHRPTPRLIGHECVGASGDLWAMEEDHFPAFCQAIERY